MGKMMNKAQKQIAQALKDCEQKIRELSERTDMENLTRRRIT